MGIGWAAQIAIRNQEYFFDESMMIGDSEYEKVEELGKG